jgi:hypothetical protein
MIVRYGLIILALLVTGCQSKVTVRPPAPNPEVESLFLQAALLLKAQEYQKASEVYLHINKDYPFHPRAEEAGVLGQELQKLVVLTQSLAASKEAALKELKEVTQGSKRLSEQNAKLVGVEKENARLESDLRQMEERLKELTTLRDENRRLLSEMDQLKASLKEIREIEQVMKKPMELPQSLEEAVP